MFEAGGPPAGVSTTDGNSETKLSFFFRNSSLLLAFLLWVEGLILFLSTVDFALIPLVSKEKEKEVLVSLKLKALPWSARVWQKARHWDTKEESISAAIFTCSSELRKSQKDQRACHQFPVIYIHPRRPPQKKKKKKKENIHPKKFHSKNFHPKIFTQKIFTQKNCHPNNFHPKFSPKEFSPQKCSPKKISPKKFSP